MDYKTVVDAGCATVFLDGRLAYGVYPEFRAATLAALDHPSTTRIQLDMSGVTFLDSSVLGMILYFRQRAQAAQKELAIVRPSAQVDEVLKIVNFSKLVPILS
ncbi:STAS domain-containing protein [Geothrix sp. PMB-07]|uniref:STAS domain-containing protein n=1 Tax=Geothrix sp. PMB-07 TaxID=3068640 RepID=UPI0027414436|nr:STAS domain-containing protein [Geothrix sp. PMB-07]WLT30258.1 STAS domain-containing protein [Geothrix sp. PMB-07]